MNSFCAVCQKLVSSDQAVCCPGCGRAFHPTCQQPDCRTIGCPGKTVPPPILAPSLGEKAKIFLYVSGNCLLWAGAVLGCLLLSRYLILNKDVVIESLRNHNAIVHSWTYGFVQYVLCHLFLLMGTAASFYYGQAAIRQLFILPSLFQMTPTMMLKSRFQRAEAFRLVGSGREIHWIRQKFPRPPPSLDPEWVQVYGRPGIYLLCDSHGKLALTG